MRRKIVPVAIISLLLGILFDIFFFANPLGLSVFLYSVLILGAVAGLADLFKVRLQSSVYLLMPAILFFAAFTFIRASGMLLFFNVVLVIYLMLLIVRLSLRPDVPLRNYTIWQYFQGMPWLPFRFFKESSVELGQVLDSPDSRIDRGALQPVLRGVAIALPILIVLVLLLSSADMVFQHYVTSIFSFHVDAGLIWRAIVALIVAAAFIGAFALLYMRAPGAGDKAGEKIRPTLGSIELSIVLGSVELLFLLFLVVQAAYLFGGNNHVLTTNFTYAEYARHGFFELIAVGFISLALIWFLRQSTRLDTKRQERTFKWLGIALVAETMVIMLSAHMRLGLYEQTYGYTRSRLLAHFFIYWLAAAFVLAAVYIVRAEKEHQFAFRLFLSVLAFFAVLNLINPDALVARHNVARLRATGKIDALSLTYLSEDATPAVVPLLDSTAVMETTGQKVADLMAQHLAIQQQTLGCQYPHWQSANLARSQAKELLAGKSSQLAAAGKGLSHSCASGGLR